MREEGDSTDKENGSDQLDLDIPYGAACASALDFLSGCLIFSIASSPLPDQSIYRSAPFFICNVHKSIFEVSYRFSHLCLEVEL